MGAQQSTPAVSTAPNAVPPPPLPLPSEPVASASAASACPLGYGTKPATSTSSSSEDKKDCVSCKSNASQEQAVVSACPVKHLHGDKQAGDVSACPVKGKAAASAPTAAANEQPIECPVKTKGQAYKNPNVYNVYNQKIDPTNQMPAVANQQPSANQAVVLPVERESSSIPKGGTDSTWLYPSPQMFWNALVRKDKTEGVIEDDILSVVRIHNNMNESTWQQILEWEKLHDVQGAGREPKLLRFLGRPDELSPKAQLKVLFGHAEPFDRHDWIVDRGGEEVRYVIDYYHDEAGAKQDTTPKSMKDMAAIKSIKTDVRPALDSVGSVIDRVVVMPYHQLTNKTQFKEMPFFSEKKTLAAEVVQVEQIKQTWQNIRNQCEQDKNKLITCQSEQECENASIALQRCTAGVVCPTIAADFDRSLQAQPFDAQKADRVYTSMVKCLELFEIDSKKALQSSNKKL